MKRVMGYTIPVFIVSILINIPKFLETKVVIDQTLTQDDNGTYNITTYTIDVTDLR